MNDEIAAILEQARLFVLQHAPGDLLTEAIPFGILCLVAGIGLSVLGAKLGRFGITCAFAALGAGIGTFFARETGFSTPACGLVGALMVGVIGFHTFRLWVGLLVAVVLSSAVLGVFGYQRVIPHVAEFQRVGIAPTTEASGTFVLPSPEKQEAYLKRTPRQWAEEFWAFVAEKDGQIGQRTRSLALAAMITGLCLGVLAVRWALILSTALVGTALVSTGIATILTQSVPESCAAFGQHPNVVGIGMGAFLVSSLILQTMLTRKAPSGNSEAKAKS